MANALKLRDESRGWKVLGSDPMRDSSREVVRPSDLGAMAGIEAGDPGLPVPVLSAELHRRNEKPADLATGGPDLANFRGTTAPRAGISQNAMGVSSGISLSHYACGDKATGQHVPCLHDDQPALDWIPGEPRANPDAVPGVAVAGQHVDGGAVRLL